MFNFSRDVSSGRGAGGEGKRMNAECRNWNRRGFYILHSAFSILHSLIYPGRFTPLLRRISTVTVTETVNAAPHELVTLHQYVVLSVKRGVV